MYFLLHNNLKLSAIMMNGVKVADIRTDFFFALLIKPISEVSHGDTQPMTHFFVSHCVYTGRGAVPQSH